ncbi:hypothetical protein Q3G72_031925 [Acer saccharum]|nr:hypothetical protein Q3G72_031925 [Acer saccharum]
MIPPLTTLNQTNQRLGLQSRKGYVTAYHRNTFPTPRAASDQDRERVYETVPARQSSHSWRKRDSPGVVPLLVPVPNPVRAMSTSLINGRVSKANPNTDSTAQTKRIPVLLLPYDSRQNCLLKGRGSLECLKAAWHTELQDVVSLSSISFIRPTLPRQKK